MLEVSVCVGSSCHMKGSYQVIKIFGELIKQNNLQDKIHLKAAFCMGRCMRGISVMAGKTPIEDVGFSNADTVFYTKIMPLTEEENQ